ncbi:MAG: acyl-CoA thioesterase [Candidatus Lokiarchaeota archaeon]|nr:acyl-CoA thioesterase [Candidatus Lokiarchaeota archaeon]
MEEEARTVSESQTQIAQLMMPEDANPAGNVFGGVILKLIDQAAGIVASRHTHRNCVTASIDQVSFLNPAYVGNVVFVKASLNYVGNTSMEIGVRAEDECLLTGNRGYIASAYLTYVALDENDQPVKVPNLILETAEQKRRWKEAEQRKKERMRRLPKDYERKQEGSCIQRPEKLKKCTE